MLNLAHVSDVFKWHELFVTYQTKSNYFNPMDRLVHPQPNQLQVQKLCVSMFVRKLYFKSLNRCDVIADLTEIPEFGREYRGDFLKLWNLFRDFSLSVPSGLMIVMLLMILLIIFSIKKVFGSCFPSEKLSKTPKIFYSI